MPLERQPAVGRLDLDLVRSAIDAERLVIVAGQGLAPQASAGLDGEPGPVDTDTIAGRSRRSPTR
jgi:hypothetical protein